MRQSCARRARTPSPCPRWGRATRVVRSGSSVYPEARQPRESCLAVGCGDGTVRHWLSAPAGTEQVNKEQMPGIPNLSRIESDGRWRGRHHFCGRGGHQGDGPRGHHLPAPGHGAGRLHRGPPAPAQGRRHPLHPHPCSAARIRSLALSTRPPRLLPRRGSSPPSSIERAVVEAAGMWLMERCIATMGSWDVDRAMEEAVALGLTNEGSKDFFLEEIRQRKRSPYRPAIGGHRSCPTPPPQGPIYPSPRRPRSSSSPSAADPAGATPLDILSPVLVQTQSLRPSRPLDPRGRYAPTRCRFLSRASGR